MGLVQAREEEDSLTHRVHVTERLSLAGNDPSAVKRTTDFPALRPPVVRAALQTER